MRKIKIDMTKAAKSRLGLLSPEDNRGYLIPMDPDLTGPFGYRFAGKTMIVTYDGRDLAYVPEDMADKKGFELKVMTSQSDVVDTALRNLFARLTRHLDEVGRVIAQAQRDQKQEADKAREESAQQQEKKNKEMRLRHEEILSKNAKDRRVLAGVTMHDLFRACRGQNLRSSPVFNMNAYSRGGNAFVSCVVRSDGMNSESYKIIGNDLGEIERIERDVRGGGYRDPGDLIEDGVEDIFAGAGMTETLMELADRTDAVFNRDRLRNLIANLPESDYDPKLTNLRALPFVAVEIFDLGDGAQIRVYPTRTDLILDDVHAFSIPSPVMIPTAGHTNKPVGVYLAPSEEDQLGLTEEDGLAIIAHAIERYAALRPETDFRPFLRINAADLEKDAEKFETGYGF